MNDILDEFKGKWNEAKEDVAQSNNAKDLITLSRQQTKQTAIIQFKNMIILCLTLAGISAYFFYVNFQELTSHIGVALMTGGLLIRILIEGYSIVRTNKIDMSESATSYNIGYLNFYTYRKLIHGPITIGILLAYTIGFFLLIPEFDQHLSRNVVILIAISYLPAAAIFGFSIRKGIRDEMKLLDSLLELQDDIEDQRTKN